MKNELKFLIKKKMSQQLLIHFRGDVFVSDSRGKIGQGSGSIDVEENMSGFKEAST